MSNVLKILHPLDIDGLQIKKEVSNILQKLNLSEYGVVMNYIVLQDYIININFKALTMNHIITDILLKNKIKLLFEAHKYKINTYHFALGHVTLTWPDLNLKID